MASKIIWTYDFDPKHHLKDKEKVWFFDVNFVDAVDHMGGEWGQRFYVFKAPHGSRWQTQKSDIVDHEVFKNNKYKMVFFDTLEEAKEDQEYSIWTTYERMMSSARLRFKPDSTLPVRHESLIYRHDLLIRINSGETLRR